MDRVDHIQAAWRRERPDLDPSPQGVIGRLHRIGRILTTELETVYADFGLSEAEFDLLASLRRAGEPFALPAGALADHTMVTSGGLTKRVDRLLERGLVERSSDPNDARRRTIRLTAPGRELIDDAFTAHIANEHRLLAALPPDTTDALRDALSTWLAVLEPDSPDGRDDDHDDGPGDGQAASAR